MHIEKKTLRNIFIGVISCIVVYWILHEPERFRSIFGIVKSIFSPFVVGAVLAFIINVPMRRIESWLGGIANRTLRRTVAIALTIILVLLIIAGVFWLLIPQIIATAETFAARLPGFFEDVLASVRAFLAENPQLMEYVLENTNFETINISSLIQKVVDMVGSSVSSIVSGTFVAIGSVGGFLVNLVISFIFALYCLACKEVLARQGKRILYAFLPEHICDETVRILQLTNTTFSNFLSGQTIEACILGCLFAIAMMIFGMPYIPLVSVLIAVTALIPLAGAFVGCFFGALFILVDNPMQAVWFVVMFLLIQQFENNVIYPRVVGTSIGLPGMWVLLAVALGGELMGVIGMFLMIPVSSVLYTLLGEITAKRLRKLEIAPEKLEDAPPSIKGSLIGRLRKKRAKKSKKAK